MKIHPLTLPITLPSEVLRMALAGLSKVATRSTLPILNSVRIVRANGAVQLEGTDLDKSLTYTFRLEPVPITALARQITNMRWTREGAQGTCVPVSSLRDAIKAAGKSDITISASQLYYSAFDQQLSLPYESLPIAEFPDAKVIKSKQPAVCLDHGAKMSIMEAMAFASTDESRFVLNGVAIQSFDGDKQCPPVVVSTDGRRLYYNTITAALPANIIVPNDTLRLMAQPSFVAADWQITLHKDKDEVGEYFAIDAGPWRLVSKAVIGQYPNWRQIVTGNDSYDHFATVTFIGPLHARLLEILRRLPPLTGKYDAVELDFTGNSLSVTDHSSSVTAIIPGVCSDKPASIWVNRRYLIDALAVGCPSLRIVSWQDPLVFTVGTARHYLMPIKGERPPALPDRERDILAAQFVGKEVQLEPDDNERFGTVQRIVRTPEGLIAEVKVDKNTVKLPARGLQLRPIVELAVAA